MAEEMSKEEALELLPNAVMNLDIALDESNSTDIRKFERYLNALLRTIGGIKKAPKRFQKTITELLKEAAKY